MIQLFHHFFNIKINLVVIDFITYDKLVVEQTRTIGEMEAESSELRH